MGNTCIKAGILYRCLRQTQQQDLRKIGHGWKNRSSVSDADSSGDKQTCQGEPDPGKQKNRGKLRRVYIKKPVAYFNARRCAAPEGTADAGAENDDERACIEGCL